MNANLTEEQEAAIGQYLADILQLKKSRDERGRYVLAHPYGTKTPVGLYRSIKRMIQEKEAEATR